MDKPTFDVDRRCLMLQRATALFGVLLLGATWPLWYGESAFPQVPLFGWAVSLPVWIDRAAVVVLIGCLVALLLAPLSVHQRAACNWLVAGLWLILFSLNQHRLQPWAYQFLLLSLLFATSDARRTMHFARALAASIYVYSAIGKFNEAFYSGIGATFLNEGLRWLTNTAQWPEPVRNGIVRGMPAGELAVGLGLALATYGMWRRQTEPLPRWLQLTCRASLLGALGMHLALLAVLGDWGLGHHWGVLLWNLFFIVQACVLFAKPSVIPRASTPNRHHPAGMVVFLTIVMALVMPATSRLGRWDHWLSWGLYSPGHGVVQVFIHPTAAAHLPDHIRAHLVETADKRYQRIDLNQWSLGTLRVPVYPSDRFQAGVALFVAKLPTMDRWVTAGWQAPSVGKPTYEIFNASQIPRLPEKFMFNAKPRK